MMATYPVDDAVVAGGDASTQRLFAPRPVANLQDFMGMHLHDFRLPWQQQPRWQWLGLHHSPEFGHNDVRRFLRRCSRIAAVLRISDVGRPTELDGRDVAALYQQISTHPWLDGQHSVDITWPGRGHFPRQWQHTPGWREPNRRLTGVPTDGTPVSRLAQIRTGHSVVTIPGIETVTVAASDGRNATVSQTTPACWLTASDDGTAHSEWASICLFLAQWDGIYDISDTMTEFTESYLARWHSR